MDSGEPWFLPGAGGTIDLNFVTQINDGSQPEIAGYASTLTMVPEPATMSLLMALDTFTLALYYRRMQNGPQSFVSTK